MRKSTGATRFNGRLTIAESDCNDFFLTDTDQMSRIGPTGLNQFNLSVRAISAVSAVSH